MPRTNVRASRPLKRKGESNAEKVLMEEVLVTPQVAGKKRKRELSQSVSRSQSKVMVTRSLSRVPQGSVRST